MLVTNPSNNNIHSGKNYSKVNGIYFNFKFSNLDSYLWQNSSNLVTSIKLRFKKLRFTLLFQLKIWYSIHVSKKIHIGPFVGEFGNFLGHILPFLCFLNEKNVEINFYGTDLLKPFCVDKNGKSFVSYFPLRSLYNESNVSGNSAALPKDIKAQIEKSGLRDQNFLETIDLENRFFYWYVYREMVAKKYAKVYNLTPHLTNPVLSSKNICAVFPRMKGAKTTHNNGEQWDYNQLIEKLIDGYDLVYVVGHPSYAQEVNDHPKVVNVITSDNKEMLKVCANANCIISQHSGVIYLSAILQKPYVLLYKGGKSPSDIGSFNNTLYFLNSMGVPYQIEFCYELEEIEKIVTDIQKQKNETTGY